MKSNDKINIVFLWFMIFTVANNCYSQIINPNEDIYSLSLCDLSLSVSSKNGGRIVSFRRASDELLTSQKTDSVYYGATFWLSPQSDYWPVYPTVDKLPYKIISATDNKICMVSQTDGNNIRITKEFSVSESDTAIFISYKIENTSRQTRKLAPWDVSRVFGGLSFFPVGENDKMINKPGIPDACIEDGMLWYTFEQKENMPAQKLFNTAQNGWLAHYYKGLLFVKCFPDIQPCDIPSGQGEVEIFVASEGRYIELENHGQYVSLIPGESVIYNQKWFLIYPGQGKTKEELLNIVNSLNKKIL